MNDSHEGIAGTLSSVLQGRTVLLGLTGSVAVMRAVDVARELIRHGARVVPVMTPAARRFIGAELLHWATGNAPILELSGANEHIHYAGNSGTAADLLLIAPATANTIGKIVHGTDDTPVTTMATTALGQGIPVLIAPAMHEPMHTNPFIQQNLNSARAAGIGIIESTITEGKAKMASFTHIVDRSMRAILSQDSPLQGQRILITAGRTVEHLDPVRVLTNNSTGKMGVALARAAYHAGAEVTLVYGKGTVDAPEAVPVVRVNTAREMQHEVLARTQGDGETADMLIAAAAVGDWEAREQSSTKTPTHGMQELRIDLVPTPKIIDEVRRRNDSIRIVAFRAQHDLSRDELIRDGQARMERAGAEMIAINDVSKPQTGFESDTNQMILVRKDGAILDIPLASKYTVATHIIRALSDPGYGSFNAQS